MLRQRAPVRQDIGEHPLALDVLQQDRRRRRLIDEGRCRQRPCPPGPYAPEVGRKPRTGPRLNGCPCAPCRPSAPRDKADVLCNWSRRMPMRPTPHGNVLTEGIELLDSYPEVVDDSPQGANRECRQASGSATSVPPIGVFVPPCEPDGGVDMNELEPPARPALDFLRTRMAGASSIDHLPGFHFLSDAPVLRTARLVFTMLHWAASAKASAFRASSVLGSLPATVARQHVTRWSTTRL